MEDDSTKEKDVDKLLNEFYEQIKSDPDVLTEIKDPKKLEEIVDKEHYISLIKNCQNIGLLDSIVDRVPVGTEWIDIEIAVNDQIIKLEPENHQAHYTLGIIFHHIKNYLKAEEHLLKSWLVDNSEITASFLVDLYKTIGDFNKAEWFYRIAERDGGTAKNNMNLGDVYLEDGRIDLAIDYFKKASDKYKQKLEESSDSFLDMLLQDGSLADTEFEKSLKNSKVIDRSQYEYSLKKLLEAYEIKGDEKGIANTKERLKKIFTYH